MKKHPSNWAGKGKRNMCQLDEKVIFSVRTKKFQVARIPSWFRKGKNDSWLIICQLETGFQNTLSRHWNFPRFLLWKRMIYELKILKNG